MNRVLPVPGAVLFALEAFRRVLLVLDGDVVAALAHSALQDDVCSHCITR